MIWKAVSDAVSLLSSFLETNIEGPLDIISISPRKLPLVDGMYTQEHDNATEAEWHDICLHLSAMLQLTGSTRAVAMGHNVGDYILSFNLEDTDPDAIAQLNGQKTETSHRFLAPVDFAKLSPAQFEQLIRHAPCRNSHFYLPDSTITMSILGPHSEIIFQGDPMCDELRIIEKYCRDHDLLHILSRQEMKITRREPETLG